MLLQLILSTSIQWVLFMILPVLSFIFYFRKRELSFSDLLGLKQPVTSSAENHQRIFAFTAMITIAFWGYNYYLMGKYELGGSDIRLLSYLETGWSISTLLIIFIQSILQTSLLEELIFRGFFINSFREKMSFNLANHIQAIIFTGLHVIALMQMNTNELDMTISVVVIYVMSLLFGKLAKINQYSVAYSIILHGASNLFAAFMLILAV